MTLNFQCDPGTTWPLRTASSSSWQTLPTASNSSSTTRLTLASSSSSGYPSGSTAPSGNNRASGQVVLCGCGVPAAKKTNTSGVNSIGKAFYTCSKETCGFWKWADDLDTNLSSGSGSVVPMKRTYIQVGFIRHFAARRKSTL